MFTLVKHKVQDYAKWKEAFDNFADFRKSSGEKSFLLLHPGDKTNDLTLLFEWDSPSNAETFFNSSELANAMQNAGVTEKPSIEFLKKADQGSF